MITEAPPETPESTSGRRASDTTALKFKEAELKSFALLQKALAEGDVETINLDEILLPGGSEDDFPQAASSPGLSASALTPEQKMARLQLALFKQSFASFELVRHLTQVTVADIKRGDVVAIETIVGSVYLRVVDRIKAVVAGTGEILCECHYDLSDQCSLVHVASIQLPVCTRAHVVTGPDGTQRLASRQLKISTDVTLPPQVSMILHERSFVDISIYANPQSEKLRFVDFGRWIVRMGGRLKAIVVANNQFEREKKRKKEEERLRRKEARAKVKK